MSARAAAGRSGRGVSRRTFVEGAAAGALAVLGPRRGPGAARAAAALSGSEFDLRVGALPVDFTGRARIATVVNGGVPGPLLRWREGDLVTVRVSNRLSVPSSIHWHGLLVPADMDGVPGLSFNGIAPGATYVYRFRANQSGTYWYHSHSRFQQQTGLYGAIVIEPRTGERMRVERDYVVLLSDWTDEDPEHIYRMLKVDSGYFNYGRRTLSDLLQDAQVHGLRGALAERGMWGGMRMDPTDLADVSGHTYTYLMNGAAPAENWTGLFRHGERVRLRFINGSSMSFFDVRIPGLKLTVVAADGQDVEPVTVDEFRIGTAEVLDAIVRPEEERAYTIFAQSLDRSGFARGTLAPGYGAHADVPALDPAPRLTMVDMAMAHDMSSHDMAGGHAMPAGQDMSAMPYADTLMSGVQAPPPPRHAAEEFGPTVDARAAAPQSRLDDPGVGLRDNGRRVLSYADLHTLGGPIDGRVASREIELHLTGHMQRYIWSFNGQKFSESAPLEFASGERLRIVLINDTMMAHPIHLHGMWGELQTPRGEFLMRKHTVTVQPGQRLAYCVTPGELGRWAYHCHLLYHMEAGMFREVHVGRTPIGTHS